MRLAVDQGTGKKGKVDGYSVAGKTGTARKVVEGRHYTASFAGIIPAADPEIAIYCLIDEPNPKIAFYGGSVAAPVFSKVAARAMRVLEIAPDMPMTLEDAPAAGTTGDPRLQLASDEERDTNESWAPEDREFADASAAPEGSIASADATGGDWFSIGDPMPETGALGTSRDMVQMPFCVGLTLAEVIQTTGEARVQTKYLGTGIAVRQSPPPNSELAPGRQAVVIFASPSLVDPGLRRKRDRTSSRPVPLASEIPDLAGVING